MRFNEDFVFVYCQQVFRCLHGVTEEDIHTLLQGKLAGDYKNSVEMAKEATRLKKLTELKKKLPHLLGEESWEATAEKYPMLTDDNLHSYLSKYK